MGEQLKPVILKTGLLSQLSERFAQLSNREQRLIMLLGLVGGLTLLWLVAIEPAINTLTRGKAALTEQLAQANRVLTLSQQITNLRQKNGNRAAPQIRPTDVLQTRLALMNWQDRATLSERGEGLYTTEVNNVPAADVLEWLDTTERLSGLTLQSVTLDKVSTGTVSFKANWQTRSDSGDKRP
jgi:general secretion pathway protein M